jgi:hypothetical protein
MLLLLLKKLKHFQTKKHNTTTFYYSSFKRKKPSVKAGGFLLCIISSEPYTNKALTAPKKEINKMKAINKDFQCYLIISCLRIRN